MIPKQKLNTQEAAAYLGIQPNTLEVWRCKHKGPRYAKADLDEFFASRSIETLESTKRDRRYRNQR